MNHWTVIIKEHCPEDDDCHGDLRLFHVKAGSSEYAEDEAIKACKEELTHADEFENDGDRDLYVFDRFKIAFVFAGWHDNMRLR